MGLKSWNPGKTSKKNPETVRILPDFRVMKLISLKSESKLNKHYFDKHVLDHSLIGYLRLLKHQASITVTGKKQKVYFLIGMY